MSKRLPAELEAPDLKMARERKEQRAVEAKGNLIETNPYLAKAVKEDKLDEVLQKAVEASSAIEEDRFSTEDNESEEKVNESEITEEVIENEIKEVRKKRGRPPMKKTLQKRRK